jgi:hypothetical protein
MDSVTLSAIAVFLAPYFKKAGEKIAEKSVEKLFDSNREIAEKFAGLFKDDIISLGLNEPVSTSEITKQLEEKPVIKEEIRKKVADNQDLLMEAILTFSRMSRKEFDGVTINADKIAQVNVNPQSVSQTIEEF